VITIYHEKDQLRTFILLIQTIQSIMKYADTYLYKTAKLSPIKFKTLQILNMNNGTMRPTQLAEWTQTEKHNITTLISRMKRDGLINIERDTVDRRSLNVILTDKGREVLKQALPIAQVGVDNMMDTMTQNDFNELERILLILRENADKGLKDMGKTVSKKQP